MKNKAAFSFLEVLLAIGIFSIIAFLVIIPISKLSDALTKEKYSQDTDTNRLISAIENDVFCGFEFLFTQNTLSIKTLNELGQEEVIIYKFGDANNGISRCYSTSTITFFKQIPVNLFFELKKLNENPFPPITNQSYTNTDIFAVFIIAKTTKSLLFELLAEVY